MDLVKGARKCWLLRVTPQSPPVGNMAPTGAPAMTLPHNNGPTPSTAAATKPDNKDILAELRSNGLWAGVITVLSCIYGQLTVACQLPPDPRVDSWALAWSPYPTMLVSLVYVAAVTWWGPRYMRDRRPVAGLRPVMMAYNAFQVAYSCWLFWEAGKSGWFGDYSYICQTCDYSNNPQAIRMMHCTYWYHFSKYIDFMDTVFFVLNKKYEHISLLHMTHHGLMPVSTWYGLKYHPGGQNTFFGFVNCLVHVVMYLYYLLAAMGPRVRPYLWWKKYLTAMQLIQFMVIVLHSVLPAFLVNCKVPPVLMRWIGFMAGVFLFLFLNFYMNAYRKNQSNLHASKFNQPPPTVIMKDDEASGVTHCAPNGRADHRCVSRR